MSQDDYEVNPADVEQLHHMWCVFKHQMEDMDIVETHLPPALDAVMRIILRNVCEELDVVIPGKVFKLLSYHAGLMFQFGQLAERNGLLWQNMEQCPCAKDLFTDESINAFLDGVNFGKEEL